jgi:transposase
MTATRQKNSTPATSPCLYVAFELGWSEWKLAFTIGAGQAPRLRTLPARDRDAVLREIAKAKQRFGLPTDAPVRSCYEAGRDGFWLHRWLLHVGVQNSIVDSSSIEVNRRQRRAKSDSLDAAKLLSMLLRFHGGEDHVWRIVTVPTPEAEDLRQLHRELSSLKDERTRHSNRLKGLLANHGLDLAVIDQHLPTRLDSLRLWDDSPLSLDLKARLLREFERLMFVDRQIKDLENERRKRIRRDETPHVDKVRRLLELSGLGLNGSWLLVMELFGWRVIANRKQLGALVGLTPTPYQSGTTAREQGISKAGNRRLRKLMVELAWCWIRWQPESELTKWYQLRFGSGKRARKVGIVAVARKLLIALWRYLEHGEIPKGATTCSWRVKVNGRDNKRVA